MSFPRFRRYALTWIAPAAALLFGAGQALAQGAAGKIQGRVVDSSGAPLAAVQVFVEGTNRGNITNAQGDYFINEVPAGLHRVHAERIGYRASIVTDQRVLAGQTLTLNFTLEPAAVQVEALVVAGERTQAVPRDQVASKSIVTGETIDQLPLDNSTSIILLQPGVISTNDGRTIRGSRPGEEAVYVDGVLVRRYQNGSTEPLELPTNGLAQVDVTTGGFGARFGEAQSGVINYVTRTGGSRFQGNASLMTDRIAPTDWNSGLTRAELSLGGPLWKNLSFFLAGVAEGRTNGGPSEGRLLYVPVGEDTTFRLATSSGDSVDVVFPEFQLLDRGAGNPFNQSDEVTGVIKLSYGLGTGNKLDLSYYKNRNQSTARATFNPQNTTAGTNRADVITGSGYFVLSQSAERALALDLKASYQRDYDLSGTVSPEWFMDHRSPFLGFNVGSPDFLFDVDDFQVDKALVGAYRSNIILAESTQIFPRRGELGGRQGVEGVPQTLRINPYGLRQDFGLFGYSNNGITFSKENRWVFNGTLDWQANRYNRVQIGGEYTMIEIRSWNNPLYTGTAGGPGLRDPRRAGLFITDRLDLGDVVIDAGLRYDYFDPNSDYPLNPGFVSNLPDSMKLGLYTTSPDPTGQLGWRDRLVPLENCGGDATAAARRRSDGTVVCKSNFVDAETKQEFSPRLAVSFPVTVASTFRLSYGHNIQVPSLGQLFSNQNNDFETGNVNTNSEFGRDIKLPKTILFEAGYRQLFGSSLVMDVSVYSKTVRNGLAYRILTFDNPKIPGQTYRANALTNADYSLARGMDLKFDRRFGQTSIISLSYSYLDAKGTASDPNTYVDLISRSTSNVALLNNIPVDAPEIMLPLDQSRKHNFALTASISLPSDAGEGVSNILFGDLGIFATGRVASGLKFTRLINTGQGFTGPPPGFCLSCAPAEPINSSETPWEKRFDLRLTKGVSIAGKRARMFADLRNPLNIANNTQVFTETGSVFNELRYQNFRSTYLNDPLFDGNAEAGTFEIAKANENPLNKYALLQAERRFGNGDGIFTLDEQDHMMRTYFEQAATNARTLRTSGQSMRLGIEIVF